MHPVKSKLVKNEERDQDKTGEANGQTGYIYKREGLMLPQIADGGPKMVFEH
jgi:hypothetical protein